MADTKGAGIKLEEKAEPKVKKMKIHMPPDGKELEVTEESAKLAAGSGYVEVGSDADKSAKDEAAKKEKGK